jgi:molybdate transport system ATP-binding protein
MSQLSEPITLRFSHTYTNADAATFTLDINAEVPGSGITAIFGRSGSGKTTLLRCMAGLIAPKEGYFRIHGEIWQDDQTFRPTHKRPLGCVFQEASLLPHLTARQNLVYGMKRAGTMDATQDQRHIRELMDIESILEHYPHQLSGGQRQRVAIARALLTRPRLLLMDEPLVSLDTSRKQEIMPYLERLRQEVALPIFYVSHTVDDVARLADHLVILDQGRVVANGPLNDVLSRIDIPTRLGNDAGVVIEAILADRDSQWNLARLEFDGGSLWVRDGGEALSDSLRVRVLARDVSLALTNHEDTSVLNRLPAVVARITEDDDQAMALVQLQVGATVLMARITRRSAYHLQLAEGQSVWAQIKSVAIVR